MTEVAIQKNSLVTKLADRFEVEPGKLLPTLKATAFRQREANVEVTNEQMMALLIVADQYKLNPFTKELYAFPDKHNGIVPVVSVDGWARIINERQQLDGIEFRYADELVAHKGKKVPIWTECIISRKDRSKPTVVREYFDEVVRNTGPWDSHPRRMNRHKSLIQCARIAFGFAGIYDEDEAERIINLGRFDSSGTPVKEPASSSAQTQAVKDKLRAKQAQTIDVSAKEVEQGALEVSYALLADRFNLAKDADMLDADATLIQQVPDAVQRAELQDIYKARRAQLIGE